MDRPHLADRLKGIGEGLRRLYDRPRNGRADDSATLREVRKAADNLREIGEGVDLDLKLAALRMQRSATENHDALRQLAKAWRHE